MESLSCSDFHILHVDTRIDQHTEMQFLNSHQLVPVQNFLLVHAEIFNDKDDNNKIYHMEPICCMHRIRTTTM